MGIKHRGKPAIHGFKGSPERLQGSRRAHVGADADTALVEEIAVTSANINDGRAGPDALPDNPGEVFADSAYRGNYFREAVRAKGGVPRIVEGRHVGSRRSRNAPKAQRLEPADPPVTGPDPQKSSGHGNEATACAGCDGAGSQKALLSEVEGQHVKSTSPPPDQARGRRAYNLKRTLNITQTG